jgi:hypothetical protein
MPEQKTESTFVAQTTYDLVRNLYKDSRGEPFLLTKGQNEIFDCIFKKRSVDGKKRIWVATITQYGKSDVVSMAVLTRVVTFGEKFAIIAPSAAKARIIVSYLIQHIFDNEFTQSRFSMKEGESADQIRRERSKNRLTFDCGDNRIGEVFVLSAESRIKNSEDVGNALMGFSSPNVLMDEAALISDEADAKAMRMVGGFTPFGTDFVVKIGNPFTRGHFLKAFEDPDYHKINIDYIRAMKEGRITEKFIEEMRKKPFFRTLYENRFPESDDIDAKGWTQLLSEDDVMRAMVKEGEEISHIGEKRIGNDVARGGANSTVWCLRSMGYAEILAKSKQDNLTEIAGRTLFFAKEHGVSFESIFIDDVGVGGGAVDPLHYEQKNVRGVNVGMVATESAKFTNIRAESYWRLREWIKKGGRLARDDDFFQLTKIKYKPDSKGRLRVMSKDEMRAHGIDSPDIADALMLTFVRKEHGDLAQRRKMREMKKKKRVNNRGLCVSMGGYAFLLAFLPKLMSFVI